MCVCVRYGGWVGGGEGRREKRGGGMRVEAAKHMPSQCSSCQCRCHRLSVACEVPSGRWIQKPLILPGRTRSERTTAAPESQTEGYTQLEYLGGIPDRVLRLEGTGPTIKGP